MQLAFLGEVRGAIARKDLVWGASSMTASLRKLLTPEQLKSLGFFLEERLKRNPCDTSLRNTKEWILAEGAARSATRILNGLQRKGGFCDCEVLSNAIPREATDAV